MDEFLKKQKQSITYTKNQKTKNLVLVKETESHKGNS